MHENIAMRAFLSPTFFLLVHRPVDHLRGGGGDVESRCGSRWRRRSSPAVFTRSDEGCLESRRSSPHFHEETPPPLRRWFNGLCTRTSPCELFSHQLFFCSCTGPLTTSAGEVGMWNHGAGVAGGAGRPLLSSRGAMKAAWKAVEAAPISTRKRHLPCEGGLTAYAREHRHASFSLTNFFSARAQAR